MTENLLTSYVQFDHAAWRMKVQKQSELLQQECHRVVEELSQVASSLAVLLSKFMEYHVENINRTFDTATKDIGTQEIHQEQLQDQLLTFVGVIRCAYDELFEALGKDTPGNETTDQSCM
ncbi:hypothetical protein IWQ62_002107 [Dispira parvispora]|uniref:Uncharacterized protein n=1 Tax=Dispira parvispora TaxID=1520584 RepID=A0A9W8AR02_9FUNG|nr:hypothetical protein IWQ62_002107 [Dispira parvispora]